MFHVSIENKMKYLISVGINHQASLTSETLKKIEYSKLESNVA